MVRPTTVALAIAIVVLLPAAYVSVLDSPELLGGESERTSLPGPFGNDLFWISLDLVLSFGVLVWALICRRSWLIVPYFLYWLLALGTGMLTCAVFDSPSLAFGFPVTATLYLALPWTPLLLSSYVAPVISALPGTGLLALWTGILINQVLLALLAVKTQAARRKPQI